MEISLSDLDIKKYIPNVIVYDQLNNQDIQLPVVILYQTQPNVGHWTLVHETKEGVEFFDSYSESPDKQFAHIPANFQRPHYLTQLLTELSKQVDIHYNNYQFQSTNPNIATCGKHCIVRHLFSNHTIDEYKRAMDITTKKLNISYDQLVHNIYINLP